MFAAALDDEEVTAFDLRHDAGESRVDEGVQGGVVEDVVGGVDLEAFVGGDGGGDVGDEVCEGWEGAGAQVGAWCDITLAFESVVERYGTAYRRTGGSSYSPSPDPPTSAPPHSH